MHIYLHVPFCRRRCSYCDFAIAVRKRIPAHEYVDLVLRELELVGPRARVDSDPLETLYLGGGTPSLLPPESLARLLASLAEQFPLRDAEVTLEANPEDVTADAARAWRAAGINRVSLGAQAFDDRVLRWMHRPHDAARIAQAVAALRGAGIENLSLDLIFALPKALERDWGHDLDRACALEPAHLSVYGLTVEERTPLARWISRGAAQAPDDERYAAEYLLAHARLGERGYRFYEVSNAARGERRSRHNQAYWTGRRYRGLGPAAHSFDGRARRWNLAAWEAYARAVRAGRAPADAEEVLTPAERELERVYLGLRTLDGIERARVPDDLLARWGRAGWVTRAGDRVVCSAEGWLRLDSLVADLTGPGDRS